MIDAILEKDLRITAPRVHKFLQFVDGIGFKTDPETSVELTAQDAKHIAMLIRSLFADRVSLADEKKMNTSLLNAWLEIRKNNSRLSSILKGITVTCDSMGYWLKVEHGYRHHASFPINHPAAIEVMRAWDCERIDALEANKDAREL